MVDREKLLESRTVYQGRRVTLRIDSLQLSSGRETTREIVKFGNCVAIVAIDSEENVLLVRQYRAPVEKSLLEIPAGVIDPGEEPEQSAYRELREETGYLARKLEFLGGLYASPGYSTEYLHLFLATELEGSNEMPDTDEISKVVQVPLKDIHGLIDSGEICDGKSVAGLLKAILKIKS